MNAYSSDLHERAGTLDSADINADAQLDVFDLGALVALAARWTLKPRQFTTRGTLSAVGYIPPWGPAR